MVWLSISIIRKKLKRVTQDCYHICVFINSYVCHFTAVWSRRKTLEIVIWDFHQQVNGFCLLCSLSWFLTFVFDPEQSLKLSIIYIIAGSQMTFPGSKPVQMSQCNHAPLKAKISIKHANETHVFIDAFSITTTGTIFLPAQGNNAIFLLQHQEACSTFQKRSEYGAWTMT